MDYQDWQPAPEPWQLWANTFFLLMGSIAFQISSNAAIQNKYRRAKKMLMLAGILTCIFLLGQVWAWSVMNGTGYSVKANPANSFFYLITGVHAAHIMGGLVAWLRTLKKIDQSSDEQSIQLSIKLCAMYWHFFLVVWLFLFYMLLVT
jgi:cytochrome c oxidase subunit 3